MSTPAEDAYRAAEEEIARVKAEAGEVLDLDFPEFHALDTLPPTITELKTVRWLYLSNTQVVDIAPIAQMTGMTALYLSNTQVADIAPIAQMTGMTTLNLSNTQVADIQAVTHMVALNNLRLGGSSVIDLRPIRRLKSLAENPGLLGGLYFKDCAAAKADRRIAEIAEIKDDGERARVLFDYLDDWVPPGEARDPGGDALFTINITDDRLEVAATKPSLAEQEERLKQVLYAQLQAKAADLCRAAGNRFPLLARRARLLEKEVAPDFADVKLLTLHLAVEDLRTLYDLGAEEEGDPFPPEVIAPLSDVLDRGPGLTLGNEDVDLLVERANRRRASQEEDTSKEALDALSRLLAENTDAVGEHLQAVSEVVVESRSAEAAETQRAVNRNVLWVIGGVAAVGGGIVTGVTEAILVETLSPAIKNLVVNNWGPMKEAAAAFGKEFADWFVRVARWLVKP